MAGKWPGPPGNSAQFPGPRHPRRRRPPPPCRRRTRWSRIWRSAAKCRRLILNNKCIRNFFIYRKEDKNNRSSALNYQKWIQYLGGKTVKNVQIDPQKRRHIDK